MKVYITKYALTQGIFTTEVRTCFEISPKMVVHEEQGRIGMTVSYHKPDWHTTRSEALDRAEAMRMAKITSLTKQVERIRAIDFTKTEGEDES